MSTGHNLVTSRYEIKRKIIVSALLRL